MVAHRSTGLISYIAVSEDTGSPMRSLRNHREISVISHRYLCYSDENRCIYYIYNHINQFLAYSNIPVIIRYENSIRPLQLRLGTGAARLRPRPLDCRWRNVPPFGQNLTDLPYHPLAFWSENNRVPSKKNGFNKCPVYSRNPARRIATLLGLPASSSGLSPGKRGHKLAQKIGRSAGEL